MTLDHFMVFAAVAKHRSVTQASADLHISQPAVSKRLRLLERNYNAKLYNQAGRGIELTEAGKIFVRGIKTILKHHEQLKQKLSSVVSGDKVESLTVGGSHSVSAEWLPSLLADFKRTHPHVQTNLRTNNTASVVQMVLNSEADIAVVNNRPPSRSLIREPFRREPLVVFALPNHPVAEKQKLTLKDLARTPVVIRGAKGVSTTTERLLSKLKKQGVNFEVAMRCETPAAVKTAVRKKAGLGILLESNVKRDLRNGDFNAVKPPGLDLLGESYIIYQKNTPLSPNAQEFLGLLRRHKRRL